MFKLLKYEFIRSYKFFITVLIAAVIANIALSFISDYVGVLLFIIFMPIILVVIYLYTIIKTFSDDLNKKTGYMIFLAPHSGYSVIGSKLIYTLLIGIIFIIIYFLFLISNFIVVCLQEGVSISDFFISTSNSLCFSSFDDIVFFKFGMHIYDLAIMFIGTILQQTVLALTIYLSITIRKSIFSNTKHGGFFSFIIFILLNIIIIYSLNYILNIMQSNNINYITQMDSTNLFSVSKSVKSTMLVCIIYETFLSILMFLGIGYLLENKINL